jgi:hypothetical protein
VLLDRLRVEASRPVRLTIAALIASLAQRLVPRDQWPELLPWLLECSRSKRVSLFFSHVHSRPHFFFHALSVFLLNGLAHSRALATARPSRSNSCDPCTARNDFLSASARLLRNLQLSLTVCVYDIVSQKIANLPCCCFAHWLKISASISDHIFRRYRPSLRK